MVNSSIMATKEQAQEISAGKIIKAESIWNRFIYIVEPLIEKAKTNYKSLEATFNKLKQNPEFVSKVPNKSYFQFATNKLEELYKKLIDLEKTWENEIDPDWGMNPTLSSSRPLHVEKRNLNIVPASGKVRKYDYIAAYNFKGFLEALYGIISEMRNIAFRVKQNGQNLTEYFVGKDNKYKSYKDINLINNDNTTEISILADQNNSSIFSFNDYIINHDSDGKVVLIPGEPITSTNKHGYVSNISTLMPKDISARIIKNSVYRNTDISNKNYKFGHQTTNHLNVVGVSSELSSFYEFPGRTVPYSPTEEPGRTFNYARNPSSGIAREFLTLNPGTEVEESGNVFPSKFKQVSNEISTYFNKNSASNLIRSKLTIDKSKTIIKASTVNKLYKSLNKLIAQISATLCGEYTLENDRENIDMDMGPKGGVGYPEIFSWYFGDITNSTSDVSLTLNYNDLKNKSINITTNEISEGSGLQHLTSYEEDSANILNKRHGLYSNANQIATEDYDRNTPIRAGMLYYGKKVTDKKDPGRLTKKRLTTTTNSGLATRSHSSLIPLSYNKYKISATDTSDWSTYNISLIPTDDYKKYMMTNIRGVLPHDDWTIKLQSTNFSDPDKQIFNRNCISYPLTTEGYLNSGVRNNILNVNSKYICAPGMTWFSWLASEPTSREIYNGTIKKKNGNSSIISNISIQCNGSNFKLNNVVGIPVVYFDRSDLWDKNEITSEISCFNQHLADANTKYGTVQLEFYEDYNNPIPITSQKNINSFEYIISGGISVNEVNHTHIGKARTEININGVADYSFSTDYSKTGHPEDFNTPIDVESKTITTNNNITSKIFIGSNYYKRGNVLEKSPEISNYLYNSIYDISKIICSNRFRFNDLYEMYHPLADSDLTVSDIEAFFIAASDNNFVEGNVTKVFSWLTEIGTNQKPPMFRIRHQFVHKANENEDKDKDIIQGNFFCSGNNSDIAKIGSTKYHYRIKPQPGPIVVKDVNFDTNGKLIFSGTCNHFWNNITDISVYVKCKTGNSNPDSTVKLSSIVDWTKFTTGSSLQPYVNVKPITSAYDFKGDNDSRAKIKYNTNTNLFDISITAKTGITAADECSCSLRFKNENGGFRDVCDVKTTSKLTDGIFGIPINSVPQYTLLYDTSKSKVTGITADNPNLITDISIPSSYLSVPVTAIGSNAFQNVSSSLENILIDGNALTEISNYAFSDCSSLQSINIPASVSTIGSYAFNNCESLTEIEIPNNITSIDQYAFSGCFGIQSITIPQYCCNNSITSTFPSYKYISEISVYSDVTSFGNNTFTECSSLENITVPTGLNSIGDNAFKGCSSLSKIYIPSSITNIGTNAFKDCSCFIENDDGEMIETSMLSDISIPQMVCQTAISTVFPDSYQYTSNIKLLDDVTNIGDNAFKDCYNLSQIIFDKNAISSIGSYAFNNCESLETIELSSLTLTSIGQNAFENCNSLSDLKLSDSLSKVEVSSFYNCSNVSSLTLGTEISNINSYAFANCSRLNSLIIPNNVEIINNNAFDGLDKVLVLTLGSKVNTIQNRAFANCSGIESIIIESDINSSNVEVSAFENCPNINEVFYVKTDSDPTPEDAESRVKNIFNKCQTYGQYDEITYTLKED